MAFCLSSSMMLVTFEFRSLGGELTRRDEAFTLSWGDEVEKYLPMCLDSVTGSVRPKAGWR